MPVTVALPPPEDRAFADVWSALGGELKPSIDVVVSAPIDTGQQFELGPPVTTPPTYASAGRGGWPPTEANSGMCWGRHRAAEQGADGDGDGAAAGNRGGRGRQGARGARGARRRAKSGSAGAGGTEVGRGVGDGGPGWPRWFRRCCRSGREAESADRRDAARWGRTGDDAPGIARHDPQQVVTISVLPETGDPSLVHLLGRAGLVEQRVRALVAARRSDDPAPDDPFRGLYLSEHAVDALLASAGTRPGGRERRAARGGRGPRAGRRGRRAGPCGCAGSPGRPG